jgi:hypothetical protein
MSEPPPVTAIHRLNHAGTKKYPAMVSTVTPAPSQMKNRPSHNPPTT